MREEDSNWLKGDDPKLEMHYFISTAKSRSGGP